MPDRHHDPRRRSSTTWSYRNSWLVCHGTSRSRWPKSSSASVSHPRATSIQAPLPSSMRSIGTSRSTDGTLDMLSSMPLLESGSHGTSPRAASMTCGREHL